MKLTQLNESIGFDWEPREQNPSSKMQARSMKTRGRASRGVHVLALIGLVRLALAASAQELSFDDANLQDDAELNFRALQKTHKTASLTSSTPDESPRGLQPTNIATQSQQTNTELSEKPTQVATESTQITTATSIINQLKPFGDTATGGRQTPERHPDVGLSGSNPSPATTTAGGPQREQSSPSRAPVLRPSIQEEASELSRKYLNLERHKQQVAATSQTTSVSAAPKQSGTDALAAGATSADEAEQEKEIILRTTPAANETRRPRAGQADELDTATSPAQATSVGEIAANAANNDGQYLQIDAATAPRLSAQTGGGGSLSKRPASSRRKNQRQHRQLAQLQQDQLNSLDSDDIELAQCQRYLQRHSTAYQAVASSAEAPPMAGNKLSQASGQVLPCTCQQTSWHFASDPPQLARLGSSLDLGQSSQIWLNCDRVQLIGSQLFTQVDSQQRPTTSNSSRRSFDEPDHLNGSSWASEDSEYGDNFLTRFSQRDAGLQVLFSQKFHYLQLSNLRSIDLSQNRLRRIKMDAFHGLENTLEFLNLAQNLLGDSRAIFASATGEHRSIAPNAGGERGSNDPTPPHATDGDRAQDALRASSDWEQDNNNRLIFISELNRLKKLKWLSLRSNQITQLAASVFYQPPSSQHHHLSQFYHGQEPANRRESSELLHLDLSDNLLKSVPSAAIQFLDKLLVLSLNNNKIIQLDQASKFPKSLKYLDLSDNLISTVRRCDLIDLPHLVELDLSNNQLRHLDQTAFVSANSLVAPPGPVTFVPNSKQAADEPSDPTQSARSQSRVAPEDQREIGQQSALTPEQLSSADTANNHLARIKREAPLDGAETSTGEILEAEESGTIESESEPGGDLETDESIFSAITSRLKGSAQQVLSEEPNVSRPVSQFNSTLRLNLSYNFFENIPGDSLLKFSKLRSLDLSHNKIRRLDSNYICSIYNLVENLRHLDLSGNLLSLNQRTTPASENQRHLNKLFGCLQRLETLKLSRNRLVSAIAATKSETPSLEANVQPTEARPRAAVEADFDFIRADDDHQHATSRREDAEPMRVAVQNARLVIKFGDNQGCKQLHTLDLSDNQLRQFPLIGLATNTIVSAPKSQAVPDTNNSAANRAQLDQWMNSRLRLEVLNLGYNYLERLDASDLEHLHNIRILNLEFNKLTALPARLMKRFSSLEELSLAGNRINSLEPVHELFERSVRTLRVLNLSNNRLMIWPSAAIQSTSLGSASNNINPEYKTSGGYSSRDLGISLEYELASGSMRQQAPIDLALEELNLEGNLLTSINVTSLFDQLIYMKSLKRLDLSYNLLNKVQSDWFKFANKNLQRLLLTGNKINSIDLGAFALNQVNELVQLNLDYNSLKELKRKTFESMPKIRELSLAHNLIHTINSETFHQLNSLQVLNLNNNKLTSWKCEYFSHLCNSISGNINVDLATLIVSHQRKHTEQAPGPPLHSGGNQLPALGQQVNTPTNGAISSLVELDLSHNSISQLRANSISVHTKLTKLDLSHNKLSFIPHDLFKATTSILSGGRQIHLVSSLKWLNLAHNRIQTIDNINFKPLMNLRALDLSFNELQSLGVDVIALDAHNSNQESATRRVFVSNNLTSLLMDDDTPPSYQRNQTSARSARSLYSSSSWPALSKLRHLNLSHNTLTLVNQSLLSELSPFVALNLDLSYNYLDSEVLPTGFFTKVTSLSREAEATSQQHQAGAQTETPKQAAADPGKSSYDLIFTLKIQSLDLSHNRLSEWPGSILDKHHASMESCNLSHNRIQNLPQNSNPMVQMKSLNLEFNPLSRDSSEMVLAEQKSARQLNLAATRLYAIQQATAEGAQYSSSMPNLRMRLVNQTSQLDLIRSISKPIEGPYLRHLNLSSNQLVWLAANVFERMHSLQSLDLSNNQLTRLHLLSNQLNQVSGSLEYLYLGSNLFTSIDSTDFNQLSRIRHLDLSNLLSLQKLNCRFLAKLSTLRRLMMFNYPQLRQRLTGLVASLHSSDQVSASERYQLKLRDELVMSTIGSHCFQEASRAGPAGESSSGDSEQSWFKLEQIELELFNNFQQSSSRTNAQARFQLTNELHQLLGPQTRRLSLVGLNLTSISDDSLLGITGDNLDLKISYTSMSQVPLKQILTSLTKRTKLKLDLRNNNIQSIDMEALQWFDELQQISQASLGDHWLKSGANDPESSSSLRLASNPFKCDCQTRPLWLWLNQRWENIDVVQFSQIQDDQIGETSTGNSANYWLKFHTVSQASDIKCFYPAKLRGRLAQHVYYNDLVCKGPSQASGQASNTGQRAKKRNETTRSSDSYYLTSQNDFTDMDDLDEEDYFDVSGSLSSEPSVKITRFNRYPPVTTNSTSMYFLTNFPTVPLIPDKSELPAVDDNLAASNRIGKRDHHGLRGPTMSSVLPESSRAEERATEYLMNSKNSKYKPNIQQKHSTFDTLTTLNSAKFGRSGIGRPGGLAPYAARQSILTESDVLILTVASIAMTIMFFVIMSVCLFKYKMDRTDEEQILSTHSKLIMSRAFFTNRTEVPLGHSTKNSSSSSSSQDKSPRGSKQSSARSNQKGNRREAKGNDANQTKAMQSGLITDQKTHHKVMASTTQPMSSFLSRGQQVPPTLLAPETHNFLMRSPTIRRMQGLAGNASDWFKYTLRAYPSASGTRRRRLFIQNSVVCGGPSQLSTSRPIRAQINPHRLALATAAAKSSNFHSMSVQSVCPSHGLKALNAPKEHVEDCVHCSRLLEKFQQVKYANQKLNSVRETTSNESATNQSTSETVPSENLDGGLQAKSAASGTGAAASFQAIIDQGDGGFMPPKMIKALAQRLDEQASAKHISTQPKLYTRDQHVRAMRTFGHYLPGSAAIDPKSSPEDDRNAKIIGSTKPSGPADGIQSQIPTIDVDGRFAYQSDSNIDLQHDYDSRVNTRGGATPASTVATNQEDIFILVRDTPTRDAARESVGAYRGGMSRERSQNLETGSQMTAMTTDYQSSAMNDECSRSSSPIAYGFMRSSPSGTTLSSSTFTGQHQRGSYLIDRSRESIARLRDATARAMVADRQTSALAADDSNQSTKMSVDKSSDQTTLDDNNNNDGNNNYANAKFLKSQERAGLALKARQEIGTAQSFSNPPSGRTREVQKIDGDKTSNSQDQIIISRL